MVNLSFLPVLAFAATTLAYPQQESAQPAQPSCSVASVSRLVNLLKVYRATSFCSSNNRVATSTVVSTSTATVTAIATVVATETVSETSTSTIFNKREAVPTAPPVLEARQFSGFGASRISQACSCLISTARTTSFTTTTTTLTTTATLSTATVTQTIAAEATAPGSCADLRGPAPGTDQYTSVDGRTFEFRCNSRLVTGGTTSVGGVAATSFQDCLNQCSLDLNCDGVDYAEPSPLVLQNCDFFADSPTDTRETWTFIAEDNRSAARVISDAPPPPPAA